MIFAVLASYYFLSRGSSDLEKIETSPVSRKNIKQEVIASGKITAENESNVKSAVSGKIVWVKVKEGDIVKKGTTIATIDRERYEIALRQAQQDVVAADAELVKVYDDISKGDSTETFDERIKRTAAEAKKNKAFDAVKLAERNLKDTVVSSPIAGAVIELNINAGEEITQAVEIAKVSQTGKIKFVAEVDEVDIVKVKKDDTVQIKLDAFEGKSFDSKISNIEATSITTSTGATAFEVEIDLDQQNNFLIGMNGEANILISEVNDVLVVPIEAVFDDQYVYVDVDDKFEKKQIEVGLSSDFDIEVKNGLSEGDAVIVTGFDEIEKKSTLQKIFKR